MRALITGGDGFTGRYVATELAQAGYEVFITCAGAPPAGAERWLQADILDRSSLAAVVAQARPEVVVHLAAISYVGHGDPAAFYTTNVVGTRNLLSALVEQDCQPRSVLLASSANVYGNSRGGMLDESTPPAPANDYAVSKLAMEYMARLWGEHLPITLVRPFNYTGRGQSENFLLPKIVAHFRSRAERIELGNLDVWRDFSDVRAVAQAYRRLLETDAAGQVVNICSGRTFALRQVVQMVENLTGHRLEIVVNPDFVRADEVRTLGGNPARLRGLIGSWENPPLEETLAWMLAG